MKFLLNCISQVAKGISFNFEMWHPLNGEQLHCKFGAIHHKGSYSLYV